LKALACTTIFYEAPHRIVETLVDLEAIFGSRRIVVAREVTKIHEEFLRGTAAQIRAQLASRPAVKGEFTVLIGKSDGPAQRELEPAAVRTRVEDRERAGVSRMDAIKAVARELGIAKREVYRIIVNK
jgi:16S rRNA (cytidine1402-2'-O)-methyltransferase